jgi:hypothetical protein
MNSEEAYTLAIGSLLVVAILSLIVGLILTIKNQ